MHQTSLGRLRSAIARVSAARPLGRVAALGPGTVHVTGLAASACLGDRVGIPGAGPVDTGALGGEIVAVGRDTALVLPDGRAAARLLATSVPTLSSWFSGPESLIMPTCPHL